MASQGPNGINCAYNDSTIGTISWASLNLVRLDDSNTATAGFAGFNPFRTTNYLKVNKCEFSIPSDATIDGILVDVDRVRGVGVSAYDASIRLYKNETLVGDDKASGVAHAWPGSPGAYMGYGGPSDLWGTTWLYSDINASGFGAAISCSGISGTGGNAGVDYVRLTVYYTVGAAQSYASGIDLYLCNSTPHDSSTPLYTTGPIESTSGTPLYTYGLSPYNSGIDLYLDSYRQSSGIPLYTYGYSTSSSGLSLFVGASLSSGLSLYEYGHYPHSGITPLYMHGSGADPISTVLGLYVKGYDPPTKSGGTALYTYATAAGVGGLYSSIPLNIYSADDPRYKLNLFIKGPTGQESQLLNLFLCNDTSLNNDLTLFLKNNYTEALSGISLYMEAPSGTDGAIPLYANMPLYIARNSEGFAGVIPLYMRVPEGQNSGLNLYIRGETTVGSGIPLVMPNTYGTLTDGVRLYTHGF